jgi:hypothetical protein
VERLCELEGALADARCRAAAAEARAKLAEDRQRRADAPRQVAEAHRDARAAQFGGSARLQRALERVADLEILVEELSRRPAESGTETGRTQLFPTVSSNTPPRPNRAERRRFEQQER